MRKIVCAANRFTFKEANGLERVLTVCGIRHWDTLMYYQIDAIDEYLWSCKVGKEEQGFMDNEYNFLSRTEAFIVATKANQIIKKSGNPESQELFSEDIY